MSSLLRLLLPYGEGGVSGELPETALHRPEHKRDTESDLRSHCWVRRRELYGTLGLPTARHVIKRTPQPVGAPTNVPPDTVTE